MGVERKCYCGTWKYSQLQAKEHRAGTLMADSAAVMTARIRIQLVSAESELGHEPLVALHKSSARTITIRVSARLVETNGISKGRRAIARSGIEALSMM